MFLKVLFPSSHYVLPVIHMSHVQGWGEGSGFNGTVHAVFLIEVRPWSHHWPNRKMTLKKEAIVQRHVLKMSFAITGVLSLMLSKFY